MKRAAIVLLLLCAGALPAAAHPVALSVAVTPDTVEMGGHVSYTIYAEWPAGWNVTPPRPAKRHPSFEIVGCGKPVVITAEDGRHEMALTCDLVAFDSGRVELPRWPLTIYAPDGQAVTDEPPVLAVDIVAPLVEEASRPLKSPESIRRDWLKIALYALGGALAGALLLAALFFLGRWLYRKITGRGKSVPAEPSEPADERALRRLAGSELEKLLAGEAAKPYYCELTEIVREYLEGRYRVPALEQTTTETLRGVAPLDLAGHESFLRDLLTVADLAKFAGLAVTAGRWADDHAHARQLVEDTRPKPEPENPAAVEAA